MAKHLGEGEGEEEEEEGFRGKSAWKKPFSSVNANANFSSLLHFTATFTPAMGERERGD